MCHPLLGSGLRGLAVVAASTLSVAPLLPPADPDPGRPHAGATSASRLVSFTLLPSGNLVHRGWSEPIVSPAPDPGPFYDLPGDDPHHYGYARHYHPWAQLDSGRTLTTTAQNWDDGVLHPMADYRPIFSETTPTGETAP